jgi:hypothetical protein
MIIEYLIWTSIAGGFGLGQSQVMTILFGALGGDAHVGA